jgi:hypothetical protein
VSGIRVAAGALLALAACEHSAPFEAAAAPSLPPRGTGPVHQVTFNVADDRTAAWLPGGDRFIYSTEREDQDDDDRCFAIQPAGGGTIARLACQRSVAHDDTTDVWESPAVNARGDLLYLRITSRIGRQKRDRAELMLGSLDDPAGARVLLAVPYTAEDGRLHSGLGEIRWLSDERFVYLAQRLIYQGSTFFPDTFLTGLGVVEVSLAGGVPNRRLVPGTQWASSVSAGGDDDTIYYTLGGDSRVFRQSLASGEVAVVHDFGEAGIARGLQVRGERLVAVVGGSVRFADEGELEMVQRDEGGQIRIADLSATGSQVLAASADTLFHRPALSPDGGRVVAEAAPFAPVHVGPSSEFNAPNHRHDLWLFDLP